jgi:tetratricopeptide (TPR) repeat protein
LGRRARATLAILACALASPAAAQTADPEGLSAYRAERFDEALARFDAALARGNASAENHFFRGLTLARLDRHAEAADALQEARRLDPTLPGVDLNLGIALYRAGDCAAATAALERSLRREPDDAAAHYFLGVCAGDQGRTDDALSHLERAAADPDLAQAAWYQIGLLRSREGDLDAAEDAFLLSARAEPETEIAAAARRQLRAVALRRSAGKRWWLRGSAGIEYDDNVSVPQVDVTTDVDDAAGVLELGAGYRILDEGPHEIELSYDLYQSLYSDVDQANLQAHTVSLFGVTDWRGFDPGLSWAFTRSLLGGDGFLALNDVALTVGRAIGGTWYVLTGYNLEALDFDDFPARDAFRHAFVLDQFFFVGEGRTHTISVRYRLEGQDADGAQFDYLENAVSVGIRGPMLFEGPLERLRWGVAYEYTSRDYSSVTPSIGRKRDEDSHEVRLFLRHPIVTHLDGVFEYQRLDQDSNLPIVDYVNNILTWRLEASF